MLRSVGGQLIRQSFAPSSHRTYTSGFRSRAAFRGLIGEADYFDAAAADTNKVQVLLDFVAWCVSEGNEAGTSVGKLSAVIHFHRVNLKKKLPKSSPLSKRGSKGVARSHVDAETPKRVRRPISWDALLEGQGLASSLGPGGRVLWMSLSLGYFLWRGRTKSSPRQPEWCTPCIA